MVHMKKLKNAIKTSNITGVMEVINNRQLNLMTNKLFSAHKDDLIRSSMLSALVHKCRPYKKVRIQYLADEMKVSVVDVSGYLSELILEDRIRGQID